MEFDLSIDQWFFNNGVVVFRCHVVTFVKSIYNMHIEYLDDVNEDEVIYADLIIIGGGPAGLTIARECAAENRRIVVLESGENTEDQKHEALNQVESIGEPSNPAQIAKRRAHYGINAKLWTHEVQPFGVRCRGLGGSTSAWAGKSASFSPIDFEKRDWISLSGWPIAYSDIASYVDRAIKSIDLCPINPEVRFKSKNLYSFFGNLLVQG